VGLTASIAYHLRLGLTAEAIPLLRRRLDRRALMEDLGDRARDLRIAIAAYERDTNALEALLASEDITTDGPRRFVDRARRFAARA